MRVQVEAQGVAGVGGERKLASFCLVGDGEPRERRHGDGHQREQHQHHRSGQAATQVLLPFFTHLRLLPIKHGEQVHVQYARVVVQVVGAILIGALDVVVHVKPIGLPQVHSQQRVLRTRG